LNYTVAYQVVFLKFFIFSAVGIEKLKFPYQDNYKSVIKVNSRK
jgi:hypothetical protein